MTILKYHCGIYAKYHYKSRENARLANQMRQIHALKREYQGILPFTQTTWLEVLLFTLKSCKRRCHCQQVVFNDLKI